MCFGLSRVLLLVILLMVCCVLAASTASNSDLRVHGSNTVGEKYAPLLLKKYLAQKGLGKIDVVRREASVERVFIGTDDLSGKRLSIELEAHGSSTGFASLLAGEADIAMASRPIKEQEINALKATFPTFSRPVAEHIIAYDALAIIVHADVEVEALTLQQLADIFSGKIENWQALGGSDLAIELFARDDNSGTYDTFKNLVLRPYQKTLADKVERFESSRALSHRVSVTAGGIGFVGVSHADANKVLAITKVPGGAGVVPNQFTVGTEDYPLSRKLFLYAPSDTKNTLASDFIRFVVSESGQALAKAAGLVSFFPTRGYFRPKSDTVSKKYRHLANFGKRLSVMIRLDEHGGLTAKARRDIERLSRFTAAYPYNRLVLAGFWDDPDNSALSQQRIQQWIDIIKAELAKRSIEPWVVHGGFMPLNSNRATTNQTLDRRIEVWTI